ncbi:hypothetical protein KFK09_027910 [Dendrobium nobile]|uniref:Membrane-associated kinase regulator 6 n=1 Tax=Dendrobium nobile TaxID=94219 RepID=A0A8T3A0P8_DENNO|nr:hypothetical protein KFK09_027910 [Dendrobium nobile]
MENRSQISIESFSYEWLNNINPTFDFDSLEDSLRRSFEAQDSSSFIEMDPDFFSIRWTDLEGFDFNLPAGCEPSDLVHADQIFSNGLLLPLSTTLKEKQASFSADSALTRSVSMDFSKTLLFDRNHWDNSVSTNTSPAYYSPYSLPLDSGASKLKLPLNRHRKNSAWKILRQYLNFLIPLYKKVKKLKMISLRTTRSCGDSPISLARMTNEFSNIEQNRAFNWEFESSIHDAVLHCKKSIANSDAEA